MFQNEDALRGLRQLACPTCDPDIRAFYDQTRRSISLNIRLMALATAHPQGRKSFTSGRVVVIRGQVSNSKSRVDANCLRYRSSDVIG
jgi:antiviral helicase SKI2